MLVYKFGGASLNGALAIKNVCQLISASSQNVWVIVSAIGKTTVKLEEIIAFAFNGQPYAEQLKALIEFHSDIIQELFVNNSQIDPLFQKKIKKLEDDLQAHKNTTFSCFYDQIIGYGEGLSALIVQYYLNSTEQRCHFIDAGDIIKTDSRFQEASVYWSETKLCIQKSLNETNSNVILTQGFVGKNADGLQTSLGKEGSDYTAAIIASCSTAESLTVWKDVPGILNADPKVYKSASLIPILSYREAAEMTYFGAKVIHPKTIRPLAQNNIPLYVKSFVDPTLPGTCIDQHERQEKTPTYIKNTNQCLLSFKIKDFQFVHEQTLHIILEKMSSLNIRVNGIQSSALSISIVIDEHMSKIKRLIQYLQEYFDIYANYGLQLLTIINYTARDLLQEQNLTIYLEQKTRSTYQVLYGE